MAKDQEKIISICYTNVKTLQCRTVQAFSAAYLVNGLNSSNRPVTGSAPWEKQLLCICFRFVQLFCILLLLICPFTSDSLQQSYLFNYISTSLLSWYCTTTLYCQWPYTLEAYSSTYPPEMPISTASPHLNYTVSLSKLIIHYLRSIGFPDGTQPFGSRHYIQRLCQTHYNNYMATCAKKESTSVSSTQIVNQNKHNLSSSTILPIQS